MRDERQQRHADTHIYTYTQVQMLMNKLCFSTSDKENNRPIITGNYSSSVTEAGLTIKTSIKLTAYSFNSCLITDD